MGWATAAGLALVLVIAAALVGHTSRMLLGAPAVGPVHAGMIEPGHFRFSVVGETILNLKARLWFVHRGIEKLHKAGLSSTDSTWPNGSAETPWLGTPSPSARPSRTREASPLRRTLTGCGRSCWSWDGSTTTAPTSARCATTSVIPSLNTHAQRIREQLLRLNDHTTGHRLLRGAITPGAARDRQHPDPYRLRAIADDIADLVNLALAHSVVRDRFTGTAVLTAQQATDLGVLGYVARASGLTFDARTDHLTVSPNPPRTSHSRTEGDVLSRFVVRAEEAAAAAAFIITLTEHLNDRTSGVASTGRTHRASNSGVGIVEGWRGTITHRIEFASDSTLSRVKIVDPSFFNWPALPVALADTIVPDFPLVNKSFNLSYSGNDL